MAHQLIVAGVYLDAKGGPGCSACAAVQGAIIAGHFETAELLWEAGAHGNPDALDDALSKVFRDGYALLVSRCLAGACTGVRDDDE